MRSLALALLVVAVLSCATPARVSSAPVGEGVSRTVPVFVVTFPARCIDRGDIETVIPPGNEPSFVKWLDLMMLLVDGRERSEVDYTRLFSEAGLKLNRIVMQWQFRQGS